MDWSQVTALTIPEGSVKQIAVGDVVLWKKSLLPEGYTQLEYISIINNAQQGYKNAFELSTTFEQADKIEMTVSAYSTIPNNAMFVTGHTTSYSSPYLYLGDGGAWGTVDFKNPIITPQYSSKQDFIDKGKQTITFTYTGVSSNSKNMLFGSWMDIVWSVSLNWYGVKVYKNNEVLHNVVPAMRNSDNVLGMYDTVTKQFFTNVGTGEFIAGDTV